ncbi:MAG TPA: 50S ribosomal protein L11 methyltransferase [Alphaproteobacteria bacterium]|nr:50S ribosomal protein L11 methyltransferase [Alphaproteobacteria bacterium]
MAFAPDSGTAAESPYAAFIRRETRLSAPPLVPEIRLHLADAITPIWSASEATLEANGVPPPYWAFAWVGGQALARHVLDHGSAAMSEKRVLDLACGCGIAAIAAAMRGAAVTAADIDPFALAAVRLNAEANGVALAMSGEDFLANPHAPCPWDIVLAGDVCYERAMAARMMDFLRAAAARGLTVWLADPGRNYLPKDGLVEIARYLVPCTREIEDAEEKTVRIFEVAR